MFFATNTYDPVWGYEANVANDYGKIMVRQQGECSWFPDTGFAWDFQIPCKAHDYCYDLRKASFSGTVTDNDCDRVLFLLLTAHCDDRGSWTKPVCDGFSVDLFTSVSADVAVTNPNPARVKIQNKVTSNCVDIEGSRATNGTPVQQWDCTDVANQQFRIWPAPGAPGYFQIKSVSPPARCVRTLVHPVSWTCDDTLDSQRFRIQGVLGQDQYLIRGKYNQSSCWSVPYSYENGVDLNYTTCYDRNNWLLWRIQNET